MGMEQRKCVIYELVPGAGVEYSRLHADVPRAVREALAAQGIGDYSIWVYGDLVVSTYVERPTRYVPEASVRRELDDWSARLAPLFRRIVDEDGAPLEGRPVFRLE